MSSSNIDKFESKDLIQGEVAKKGITVTRSDGVDVSVSSATYQRFKSDGTAMDETPQVATIDDDEVSANITAGTTAGRFYVDFTYVVGAWTRKARLYYDVV